MTSHFFNRLGETVLGIFKETEEALLKPQDGQPQSVEVIFVNRHQDVDLAGKKYGDPKPVAWIKTGLADIKYNDVLCITDIEYNIVEIRDDGLELTRLDLQET